MLQLLLTHIPSTLLHILTGMLMMDLVLRGHRMVSQKKRLALVLSGAALVLLPDIPKLLGSLYFHSLLTIPVITILLTYLYRKFVDFPFVSLWGRLTLVLLIGALLIDFLGNGAYLFFPITTQPYSITLLQDEIYYLPIAAVLLLLQLRRSHRS